MQSQVSRWAYDYYFQALVLPDHFLSHCEQLFRSLHCKCTPDAFLERRLQGCMGQSRKYRSVQQEHRETSSLHCSRRPAAPIYLQSGLGLSDIYAHTGVFISSCQGSGPEAGLLSCSGTKSSQLNNKPMD
ncbi:Uncharacterized protein DAT39_007782 [Clarias magur]|uniref:Uncharacterized protein n=1 Tax=Clarias magur TaxID=1594786 RepID=A0A8J4X2X3_CLAMG|nr:Uncharacterized protein DAT39_007782 [Clarias magur]